MEIELLFTLMLEVLISMGVFLVTDKGKLLHCPAVWVSTLLNRWFGEKVSRYITSPLYDCIICMGSFWGAVTLLTWHPEHWHVLPLFMLAASGINGIVWVIYEKSTER